MTREEKAVIIEELTQKFRDNPFFYVTDTSDLTVAEVNNLRRLCFERGVEYKVLKNTLIKKALENVDGDFSPLNENVLKGFSGVFFSATDGKTPAKLIKEFRTKVKGNEKPILKGASIDSDLFIGNENLDTLINLKSKAELVGEIIGLLQSPAKNVLSALQSSGNKLAGIIKTLSEKEGEAAS
jgi:large subunit ribosomal protein L10